MSKYAPIHTLDNRLFMLGFTLLAPGKWRDNSGRTLIKKVIREYRRKLMTGLDGKPRTYICYGEPKTVETTWEIRDKQGNLLWTACDKRHAVDWLEKPKATSI